MALFKVTVTEPPFIAAASVESADALPIPCIANSLAASPVCKSVAVIDLFLMLLNHLPSLSLNSFTSPVCSLVVIESQYQPFVVVGVNASLSANVGFLAITSSIVNPV